MTFEDKFTNKQKDMIRLVLEYIKKIGVTVDNTYIYCSHESNMYTFDVFFNQKNNIVLMNQLSLNSDSSLMLKVL